MKRISLFGYQVEVRVNKKPKPPKRETSIKTEALPPYKLNLGPGPNWEKPDASWLNVDVEPDWGDIVVDFNDFEFLPLEDACCLCVYGSHVFEHMSIFKTPLVFSEIYRVLQKGGVFRLILPDAEKSIREYINRNEDFLLFKRRRERQKLKYGNDYTLFECLREDFISPSGQPELLGKNSLAHQNAWDYETISSNLVKAGFAKDQIHRVGFQQSSSEFFDFEGSFPSEANEHYRSLYVEAVK